MEKKNITIKVEIPAGVQASINKNVLLIKGPKGEVSKPVFNPKYKASVEGNIIVIKTECASRNYKKVVNALRAHIKNMIKGAKEGYVYKMKICASHFPMTAELKGNNLEVKNFFGERKSRSLKIRPNVKVTVKSPEITIESADKDLCGITATDIERLVKRPGFDPRRFQDGIYLTSKDGKPV